MHGALSRELMYENTVDTLATKLLRRMILYMISDLKY